MVKLSRVNDAPSIVPAGGAAFATTHLPDTGLAPSLTELCRDYWMPLYGFVRGRGYEAPVALGVVRDFVDELAAASTPGTAGALRPFLLASLKYHLFRRPDREPTPSPDLADTAFPTEADVRQAEDAFAVAKTTAAAVGEDQLFEWRWAEVLVRRALDALSDEYAAGRRALLETLRPFVTGGTGVPSVADAARQLGSLPETVEVELAALRSKYGEALRREAARTVERPEHVADELRQLCRTLASVPAAA